MIFLAEAAASSSGVAPTLKPVEKLKVDDYIENGGFDSDSVWIKNTHAGQEATISGGKGRLVGDGSQFTNLQQNDVFEVDKVYKVSLEAEIRKGELKVQSNGYDGNIGLISKSGKHSFYFTGISGSPHLVLGRRSLNVDFDIEVDNVSVKEVEQEAVDFTVVRSSHLNATRVGHDKFIKRGRENLIGNSVWDGAGTDTRPSGTSWVASSVQGGTTFAPVSSNPDRITFSVTDASGSSDRVYLVSKDITTPGVYTMSVRVNAVTGTAPTVNQVISAIADGGTKTNIAYFKDGVKISSNRSSGFWFEVCCISSLYRRILLQVWHRNVIRHICYCNDYFV